VTTLDISYLDLPARQKTYLHACQRTCLPALWDARWHNNLREGLCTQTRTSFFRYVSSNVFKVDIGKIRLVPLHLFELLTAIFLIIY